MLDFIIPSLKDTYLTVPFLQSYTTKPTSVPISIWLVGLCHLRAVIFTPNLFFSSCPGNSLRLSVRVRKLSFGGHSVTRKV